jgi:hypothetical protein
MHLLEFLEFFLEIGALFLEAVPRVLDLVLEIDLPALLLPLLVELLLGLLELCTQTLVFDSEGFHCLQAFLLLLSHLFTKFLNLFPQLFFFLKSLFFHNIKFASHKLQLLLSHRQVPHIIHLRTLHRRYLFQRLMIIMFNSHQFLLLTTLIHLYCLLILLVRLRLLFHFYTLLLRNLHHVQHTAQHVLVNFCICKCF